MLSDELSSHVSHKEQPDLFEGLAFLKNPASFSGRLKMAKAAYESGDYKQAYAAYSAVLPQCESDREKAACVYNMGSCQLKLHNFSLARKHYESALSIQTAVSKVQKIKLKLAQLHSIGEAVKQAKTGLKMFKEERFVQAKAYFTKAVSLADESKLCPDLLGTYYYNVGSCHARLGETVQAMEACRVSAEIRSAHFGVDHPSTLSSMKKLSFLQDSVGFENRVELHNAK
jgi:tetratricopeptide (TPR) repeat protein